MKIFRSLLISPFLLQVCLALAGAWMEEGENTRLLESGQRPAPARMDDISWIAGCWRGEGLGGVVEEVWSTPADGSMMGMFRFTKDGGVRFYELITIGEEDGSLVMRLKHFGPDLTGWEEKGPAQVFPLVALGPSEAFFDGITYRKTSENTLRIFVRDLKEDGSAGELEFSFERVR